MAESCTITEVTHTSVKLVLFSWTSASDGTCTGTTTSTYDGELLHFITVPDGENVPTDDYDVVINDSNGLDILFGAGADRDTADIEIVQGTSLGSVAGSKLTLEITNAGDTKSGTIGVYIR